MRLSNGIKDNKNAPNELPYSHLRECMHPLFPCIQAPSVTTSVGMIHGMLILLAKTKA